MENESVTFHVPKKNKLAIHEVGHLLKGDKITVSWFKDGDRKWVSDIDGEGVIEGKAAKVLRQRAALAPDVKIFADVRVKHASPLAPRPLDQEEVTLEVSIRTQACNDDVCLLPKTLKLSIAVPLDVIDIPKIGMHTGHGQREGAYDGTRHLLRLFLRKARKHPLGLLTFVWKNIRLEREARRRAREAAR